MVEDLVELSDETRREQQRFKGLRRRTCLTRRDCVFDCDENTSFCSYKYIMRSCFSFLIYLRRYWCHVYKCFEECENIIRVRRKLWTKTGKIIEGKLEMLKFFLSFGQIVSLTTARINITSKLRYCVTALVTLVTAILPSSKSLLNFCAKYIRDIDSSSFIHLDV